MTTQEILDKLNAYHGDDIWQDVILQLDEYSEEKTDAVDQGSADRFALDDGTIILMAHEAGKWIEKA